MSKKYVKTSQRTFKKAMSFLSLTALPLLAYADELPAIKGASDWLLTTVISVAITVLGLQTAWELWGVYIGKKEARDVVKPILICAAFVSLPVVMTALAVYVKQ